MDWERQCLLCPFAPACISDMLLPQDLWEEGSTGFASKSLCISFLQEHKQLLLGFQVLVGHITF